MRGVFLWPPLATGISGPPLTSLAWRTRVLEASLSLREADWPSLGQCPALVQLAKTGGCGHLWGCPFLGAWEWALRSAGSPMGYGRWWRRWGSVRCRGHFLAECVLSAWHTIMSPGAGLSSISVLGCAHCLAPRSVLGGLPAWKAVSPWKADLCGPAQALCLHHGCHPRARTWGSVFPLAWKLLVGRDHCR